MSYLRETIGSYIIEFGTRYDYIVGKWFFHGILRVPTGGSFALTATDGVNVITDYTLRAHPTLRNTVIAPDAVVSDICYTPANNFYTNCVAIDGWMETSDTVTVPDFTITLTPGDLTPYMLTSVASTCLYGSGLDDWTEVSLGERYLLGSFLANKIWLYTYGRPYVSAWDNGTSTPNLRFQYHYEGEPWSGYPWGLPSAVNMFYTMNVSGVRCSLYDNPPPSGSESTPIPIFNVGSPITYYTGDTPIGASGGATPKCSSQRRLAWVFSPADYTVAAATKYNTVTKA